MRLFVHAVGGLGVRRVDQAEARAMHAVEPASEETDPVLVLRREVVQMRLGNVRSAHPRQIVAVERRSAYRPQMAAALAREEVARAARFASTLPSRPRRRKLAHPQSAIGTGRRPANDTTINQGGSHAGKRLQGNRAGRDQHRILGRKPRLPRSSAPRRPCATCASPRWWSRTWSSRAARWKAYRAKLNVVVSKYED